MMAPAWKDWFNKSGASILSMTAWRGVEAQHVVSSMRLSDTADEHDVLEELLESSKPAQEQSALKHYLLFTPFRYRPRHGSRFRQPGSSGVWYGAEELYAACAEVAYWRHRFLLDSEGLAQDELLTVHTFFQADIRGKAIDLMKQPWVKARARWTHTDDYSATQALAAQAREHGLQWIRYESVRAPRHRCAAVLDVHSLDLVAQGTTQQTWHCKATQRSVMMARNSDTHVWEF
jgi:hypothetical protein